MYLKDIDWKNIGALLIFVKEQGGCNFLRNIKIRGLANKRGKIKCSCCKKILTEKTFVLITTERPVFDDSFHSPKCAEMALRWLLAVCFYFKEYIEPKNSSEIPEVRDPLPIQNGETLRAYRQRYENYQTQKKQEFLEI